MLLRPRGQQQLAPARWRAGTAEPAESQLEVSPAAGGPVPAAHSLTRHLVWAVLNKQGVIATSAYRRTTRQPAPSLLCLAREYATALDKQRPYNTCAPAHHPASRVTQVRHVQPPAGAVQQRRHGRAGAGRAHLQAGRHAPCLNHGMRGGKVDDRRIMCMRGAATGRFAPAAEAVPIAACSRAAHRVLGRRQQPTHVCGRAGEVAG